MAPGKRLQVMLRPEVYDIVKELADEDKLSNSKTMSILVEQALVSRSLWDAKTRKRIPKEVQSDPHFRSVGKIDLLDGLPENVDIKTYHKNQQPELKLDPE